MENNFDITTFCIIKNHELFFNGQSIFKEQENSNQVFLKNAYKELIINYPKYFKMDNLSKLALIGTHQILSEIDIQKENNIALLFANKSSCLDIDCKHQESIQDKNNYFPSPANFVYTLPNICLGEIAIKFNLKSENSFFIFDKFLDANNFIFEYAKILIDTNKAEQVLCGWTEFLNEKMEACFYLVSKNNGTNTITINELNNSL